MATTDKSESHILGPCILSFPSLFAPRAKVAQPGEAAREPKFEAVFVVPAEIKEQMRPLKAACLALLQTAAGGDVDLIQQKIQAGGLHWPFKPVTDEPGYPKGGTILRGTSKYKPGTVSRYADPATGKAAEIKDAEKFYPGALVRVSLRPYLFGFNVNVGKKGLTFNINNVQLCDDLAPGARLDNRMSAEDEFDSIEALKADIAANGNLTPTGVAYETARAGNALLD